MLKFLLIFFIVIYLLGFIGRMLIKNWLRKMGNHNESQSNDNRKEGEVIINTNTKDSKKFNKTDGDYVDYEEVE
ncbi:MAG: hypothetical protein JEZ09_07505 [Salinivirgaceae bacterium]|nr:hypothetical protein [Salinivirgaceae bacterium]